MNLKEVFDQLTTGELSQISIGGGVPGSIQSANYVKVAHHVNLGLAALYKRFSLKEGKLVLQLNPATTDYKLTTSQNVATGAEPSATKYILATNGVKFAGDLMKVERVYTDLGEELLVNDTNDAYSLSTPVFNLLRVPEIIVTQGIDMPEQYKTEKLTVHYRAAHPKIDTEDMDDPEDIELELPETHLEALLLFVASRVHTPTGLVGEYNQGNNWYQRYEMECQALETQGLEVNQGSTSDRLVRNGWV